MKVCRDILPFELDAVTSLLIQTYAWNKFRLLVQGVTHYWMIQSCFFLREPCCVLTFVLPQLTCVPQIVYMKDGVIHHQGTLEDIREENPELVANWSAVVSEMEDSESDAEDVKEERAKLVRQVSVIMEEEKKVELARGWF